MWYEVPIAIQKQSNTQFKKAYNNFYSNNTPINKLLRHNNFIFGLLDYTDKN